MQVEIFIQLLFDVSSIFAFFALFVLVCCIELLDGLSIFPILQSRFKWVECASQSVAHEKPRHFETDEGKATKETSIDNDTDTVSSGQDGQDGREEEC